MPDHEPSVDDDPKWWVLVDGEVYIRDPVDDAAAGVALHDEIVRLVRARGVTRDRVSLVRVGKAWGRAHYVGS